METNENRLINPIKVPSEKEIAKWVGKENFKRWKMVLKFIHSNYEGIFKENDWIFGGKKHGWSLRFKRSKSFCTLIPERDHMLIVIVFGKEERSKTETILNELDDIIVKTYKEAKTYHDGKWVLINFNKDKLFEDIKKLLLLKRKPKPRNN